jgi:RNA polymerase sigma-70 factor (ECF subfamily)
MATVSIKVGQDARFDALNSIEVNGFLQESYLLHRDELCRYIVKQFGRNTVEPEDVIQATFAKLAALDKPELIENPRAFLYKMAYNVAVDMQRRAQVRDKHIGNAPGYIEAMDEASPERVLDAQERLSLVSKALWGMPKKRRRMLIMSRFEDLSYAEISRRTGLSETVVRKHVSNALADCQKALKGGVL